MPRKLGRQDELQLPGVGHDHGLRGLVPLPHGLHLLHPAHHVHALHHFAKDHVLPVQVRGLLERDEELGAVGVGPLVGHGQEPRAVVREREGLVLKGGAVDGLAPGAVLVLEVPALAHEALHDAVEDGPLVAQARAPLPGAEAPEVLARARGHVVVELHHDPPRGQEADLDVHEDPRSGRVAVPLGTGVLLEGEELLRRGGRRGHRALRGSHAECP
mmetsp:Transcript_3605/g.12008  ORF Transcript_3605/g.12008 Transcript_3605/m.12008 type:complete len:216 (-) Transcript_3605:75-722(-)